MNIDIKTAVVFFGLGLVQGMIVLDWLRDKQLLRALDEFKAKGETKAVLRRKAA